MKQLHTTDIVAGDGQKMRQQMVENFEIIQQEDVKDDSNLVQEVQDRKDADNSLQKQIDKVNDRLDKLDAEKATHDDLEELREELLKKIKHIILGTDEETVKAVIEEMKKEGTI